MRRLLVAVAALLAAGCSSGGTETVEVTTTLQVTTTVQAAPTIETTTGPALPSTDPDDATGRLDVRNLNATRNDDLLAVSLTTYEPWNSAVLAGPGVPKQGPNRVTVSYDVDLDGTADYRGRMLWAGGELSLFVSGSGSQFEPIPVERPDQTTAQFVHPIDISSRRARPTGTSRSRWPPSTTAPSTVLPTAAGCEFRKRTRKVRESSAESGLLIDRRILSARLVK